jgi:hypothetical protein
MNLMSEIKCYSAENGGFNAFCENDIENWRPENTDAKDLI